MSEISASKLSERNQGEKAEPTESPPLIGNSMTTGGQVTKCVCCSKEGAKKYDIDEHYRRFTGEIFLCPSCADAQVCLSPAKAGEKVAKEMYAKGITDGGKRRMSSSQIRLEGTLAIGIGIVVYLVASLLLHATSKQPGHSDTNFFSFVICCVGLGSLFLCASGFYQAVIGRRTKYGGLFRCSSGRIINECKK
jgi:hypothetical protein